MLNLHWLKAACELKQLADVWVPIGSQGVLPGPIGERDHERAVVSAKQSTIFTSENVDHLVLRRFLDLFDPRSSEHVRPSNLNMRWSEPEVPSGALKVRFHRLPARGDERRTSDVAPVVGRYGALPPVTDEYSITNWINELSADDRGEAVAFAAHAGTSRDWSEDRDVHLLGCLVGDDFDVLRIAVARSWISHELRDLNVDLVAAVGEVLGDDRLAKKPEFLSVSYTHLTLPTIYSV